MKQEQTIDDILKMLKDSVNSEQVSNSTTEMFEPSPASISDEHLKEQLQKQFGEESAVTANETAEANPYALDDDFLQEAAEIGESELLEMDAEEDELTAIDSIEELVEEEILLEEEALEGADTVELTEEDDLAPWEDAQEDESTEENILEEEAEDSELFASEEEEIVLLTDDDAQSASLVALDYVNEEEEELEYEILPRLAEEELTALILRDYSTDPVPVGEAPVALEESEPLEVENLLSGLTYTTPALNPGADAVDEAAYELMRQLGCEDEWTEEEIPAEEPKEVEEASQEFESYAQTDKILASYRTKKLQEIIRLCGVIFGSLLLFFYETLPMLGVTFTGMFDAREYIGAYLLIGFQILLICAVAFGKRMAFGALRIFSLRPNLYSLAALAVIFTGAYDLVILFSVREQMIPFHFLSSLVLVALAVGEYLMLSREIKAFSVVSSKPDANKYTLHHHTVEDACVQKMKRGGLSEEARVAFPERCKFPKGFFRSIRTEEIFGSSMVSFFLIPTLLLSMIAAVVTMLLHWEFETTLLAAISVLMAILPFGAILAVCFPLWISSERLAKREIALMGQPLIEETAATDVLVFNDIHLFRQCTATDTGFAFYEKSQTATILGCLELLYSKIGGPLAGAFANIPEQYRFDQIRIRRIVKGGVEAIVDRKHMILVGDAEFMARYGLHFPKADQTVGRTTIFISLNGKISAKMSVRYQPEPIFEMLAERMNQKGIQCVIKTFDPMISAATVAHLRSFGDAPISVLHQNLSELTVSSQENEENSKSDSGTTAVVSVASRFKLVEAVIWSKALVRIHRANQWILGIFGILGLLAVSAMIVFEKIAVVNQYWFILWGLFANLLIILHTLLMLPKKKYFSVDACRAEWQVKQQKAAQKQQKKKGNK